MNEKYTLEAITLEGVTVTSPNDSRNKIKWFSSDKAIIYSNKYFFTASDETTGRELWATDGTPDGIPDGTKMVKNIFSGTESSDPDAFMIAGPENDRRLYFRADDEVHGLDLSKGSIRLNLTFTDDYFISKGVDPEKAKANATLNIYAFPE